MHGFKVPVRVNHSHSSFQAIVECTLPSASSQDLGLDDHVISAYNTVSDRSKFPPESINPYRCSWQSSPPLPQYEQPLPLVRRCHTANRKPIFTADEPFALTVFSRFAERYSCMERSRFCCKAQLRTGMSCCCLSVLPILYNKTSPNLRSSENSGQWPAAS